MSKWKVMMQFGYDTGNMREPEGIRVNLFEHEMQAIGYAQAMNEHKRVGDWRYKVVEVPDETYWAVSLQVKVGRWAAKPCTSMSEPTVYTNLGYVEWGKVLATTGDEAINRCREHVLGVWLKA